MKKYLGLKGHKLSMATLLLVALPSIFNFGYNQGVFGGVLTLPTFLEHFPQLDTVNTTGAQRRFNSNIQGTVTALYAVGGMFGAVSVVWIGDILGRRKTIFIAHTVQIIGALLMGTSFSFGQLIVSRLILGLGTGAALATVPVWQSECSVSKKRGAHVVSEGTFIGIGLSSALWIEFGLYFAPASSSVSWRFPFLFQIVIALIVLVFITLLPESPRWLIKKNRVEEARVILGLLEDDDPYSESVSKNISDIQTSLEITGHGKFKDLFTMGPTRNFHRVAIAAIIQMFLQMTGINAVAFYTTVIFEVILGYSAVNARILASSFQFAVIFSGIIATYLVDRVGRRKLMLFSATGNAISLAIVAATTSFPENHAAVRTGGAFVFIYGFTYTLGFLGIPFLYGTEVAPLHLRAAMNGISVGTSWAFNFLVVMITVSF